MNTEEQHKVILDNIDKVNKTIVSTVSKINTISSYIVMTCIFVVVIFILILVYNKPSCGGCTDHIEKMRNTSARNTLDITQKYAEREIKRGYDLYDA